MRQQGSGRSQKVSGWGFWAEPAWTVPGVGWEDELRAGARDWEPCSLPPSLNSYSGLAGSKKPKYGTPGEKEEQGRKKHPGQAVWWQWGEGRAWGLKWEMWGSPKHKIQCLVQKSYSVNIPQ